MSSEKKNPPLDPDGNTTSTNDVPEQGQLVGASNPHQGTWEDPKGGKIVGPPARGHVEKPVEKDVDGDAKQRS